MALRHGLRPGAALTSATASRQRGLRRPAGAVLLAPLLAAALLGAGPDDDPRVDLSLHAGPAGIALELQIEPGWHVYWSNPGDSGLATAGTARLDGEELGAGQLPAPRRFEEPGGIVSFGYADRTALFWDTAARPGQAARVEARWLACRERCVYQTGEAATTASRRPWPEPVRRLEEQRPAPSWELTGLEVRAQANAERWEATLRVPGGAVQFFPGEALHQLAPEVSVQTRGADSFIHLAGLRPPDSADTLDAVVVVDARAYEIAVPCSPAAVHALRPLPELP